MRAQPELKKSVGFSPPDSPELFKYQVAPEAWQIGGLPLSVARVPSIVEPDDLPIFRNGSSVIARLDDEDYFRVLDTFNINPGYLQGCFTCKATDDKLLVVFENNSIGRWNPDWELDDHYCDCQQQWNLRLVYHNAGIPSQFFPHRFNNPDRDISFNGDERLVEMAATYLANVETNLDNGIGLVVSGAGETGKSMALFLILKELVKLGHSAYAIAAEGLIQLAMDGWKVAEEREAFDRYILGRRVLFIDDLGKESKRFTNNSRQPDRILQEVLSIRNDRGMVTFVSTDRSLAQLRKEYPDTSQLIEDACYPLVLGGSQLKDEPEEKVQESVETSLREWNVGFSTLGKKGSNAVAALQGARSASTDKEGAKVEGTRKRYKRPNLRIDGKLPQRKVI